MLRPRSSIKARHRRSLLGLLAWVALAGFCAPALSSEAENEGIADHSGANKQDSLAQAVREGRARPLSELQASLAGQFPGEVVGVEVENDGLAWIYEFKTITPDGMRADVYVDGSSGKILRIEKQ